eukprot:m.265925 g.265925  ORF g.265925 m.265925 type:complete len:808 (-) comp64353_c0_seq1:208-2631(-)
MANSPLSQSIEIENAGMTTLFMNHINSYLAASIIEGLPSVASTNIVGTLLPEIPISGVSVTVVSREDTEAYDAALLSSDCVVFDITSSEDEIEAAIYAFELLKAAGTTRSNIKPVRFILVSTFMTWAHSPPIYNENEQLPYTEDEFRGRIAHPHFLKHQACEKLFVKEGWDFSNAKDFPHAMQFTPKLDNLHVVVLTTGVMYGEGENMLQEFFQRAWSDSDLGVPKIGPGDNILPTIHVSDLGSIISRLLIDDDVPLKPYMIACDAASASTSLAEITDAVAAAFTTTAIGKTQQLKVADAFCIDSLDQLDIDTLTSNFRIESSFGKRYITWKAHTGIVSNIKLQNSSKSCVNEFINVRGLEPIRLCIFGPPSSGKTELCKALCERFAVSHVDIQAAIKFAFSALTQKHKDLAAKIEASLEVPETEQAEFDQKKKHLVELTNSLEHMTKTIENNKVENKIDFSPSEVQSFFKEILRSKKCSNQGFVLDGYPETGWKVSKEDTDAESIFGNISQHDGKKAQAQARAALLSTTRASIGVGGVGSATTREVVEPQCVTYPDFAIFLCAKEPDLRERLMNLPQSEWDRLETNHVNSFQTRWQTFAEAGHTQSKSECKTELKTMTMSQGDSINQLVDIEAYFHARNAEFSTQRVDVQVLDAMVPTNTLEAQVLNLINRPDRVVAQPPITTSAHTQISRAPAQEASTSTQVPSLTMLDTTTVDESELMSVTRPAQMFLTKHVMTPLAQALLQVADEQPEDPIEFLSQLLLKASKDFVPELASVPDGVVSSDDGRDDNDENTHDTRNENDASNLA